MLEAKIQDSTANALDQRPGCVIIGDVLLYREGLANGLRRLEGVAVFGSYSSVEASDAIDRCAPEVVVLDITHADTLSIMQPFICSHPDLPFVGFGIGGQSDAIRCAESGISAFVGRDETIEDLNRAVLKAVRGEAVCSPRLTARLIRHLAALTGNVPQKVNNCLTVREREVASLVKEDLSNKEIAKRLGISPATVKNHVHMILEKLDMPRRGSIGRHV